MRSTYRALAGLVAVGVVLQAAFIAFAWFDVLSAVDGGEVFDENSEGNIGHMLHGIVGMMGIPLVCIALLIVSFFARIPGGVRWAAIVLAVAVVQVLLAFASFEAPVLGLLHGANALVLAIVAGRAARQAGVGEPASGPAPSRAGASA